MDTTETAKETMQETAGLNDEMNRPAKQKISARENSIQFVKFTLFSISAGVIQAASFTLMNETTHLPYWPSYLTALALSVVYNFTVNRRFTFKSAANVPIAMLKVAGYYLVFTPLSTWGGNYMTEIGANYYVVLAVCMVANFVTEFLFTRFVVYRNNINTRVPKETPPKEA